MKSFVSAAGSAFWVNAPFMLALPLLSIALKLAPLLSCTINYTQRQKLLDNCYLLVIMKISEMRVSSEMASESHREPRNSLRTRSQFTDFQDTTKLKVLCAKNAVHFYAPKMHIIFACKQMTFLCLKSCVICYNRVVSYFLSVLL